MTNNNSGYSWSTRYVLDTVLSVLHLFVLIIFATIIRGWCNYQPHFTKDETKGSRAPANRNGI